MDSDPKVEPLNADTKSQPEELVAVPGEAPKVQEPPLPSGPQQAVQPASPQAAQSAPLTSPQLDLRTAPQGTIAFEGTASLQKPSEASVLFNEFKEALFELIAGEEPRDTIADRELASPSRILLRLFTFAPQESALSYQKLVAAYVALWAVLERPEYQHYSSQALLGLRTLATGRLRTSTNILREIEFQTSTPAALTYVMRGVGTFIRGLALISILITYPLVFFSISAANRMDWPEIAQTTWFAVSVAAVCGMLGSGISILLRLSEFETTKGRSQMFLILTGATLPLVGGVFGAFVAALLSAKVVNIQIGGTDAQNIWLYVVLGFLSGFSERFSRGFISMAEDRLGAGGQRPANSPKHNANITSEARLEGTITPAT